MSTFLTTQNILDLQAANLYVIGAQAYELPFDRDYAQRLANVAVQCGFSPNTGRFLEAVKLHPLTTLVKFIEYVGGNTAAQANANPVGQLPVPR